MPTPFQSLGTIDGRSADIVLTYVDDKPTPIDVPARDLHGGDLRRIAWVRENARITQERDLLVPPGEELADPPEPEEPDARALRSLAADLVETGAFKVTHPVKAKQQETPAEPEPLIPPEDAPAPPAEPEQ